MKKRISLRKTILSYLIVFLLLLIGIDLFVSSILSDRYLLFALFSLVFIAIVMDILQIRKVNRSIEEITAFSREVAAGDFRRHLIFDEKMKLAELGKNISDMANELRSKVHQREAEKFMTEAILRNLSDGLMLIDVITDCP